MDESDSDTLLIPNVESKAIPRDSLCQDKMECIEEEFYGAPDYKPQEERIPFEFFTDLPKREVSMIYSPTNDYIEMKPVYGSPSRGTDKTALSPIKSCFVDLERAVISTAAIPMEISRQISLQKENSILIPKREVPLPFIESMTHCNGLNVSEFQASSPIVVKQECSTSPRVDFPSEIDSVTLPNESQDIKFIKRSKGNRAKKRSLKNESEEPFADITDPSIAKKRKSDAESSFNNTASEENININIKNDPYLETEENYHQSSNHKLSSKHKKPKKKSASKELLIPMPNLDGSFSSTVDTSSPEKKHKKKSSVRSHEKSSGRSDKRESSSTKKKDHDLDQKKNISSEKSSSHSEKRKSSSKKREDHDADQKTNAPSEKSSSHSEKRKSSSEKKKDHVSDGGTNSPRQKSSSHSEKRKSSSKTKEGHESDTPSNNSLTTLQKSKSSSKTSSKRSSSSSKRSSSKSSSRDEKRHESDRKASHTSKKSGEEKQRGSSKKSSRDKEESSYDKKGKLNPESDKTPAITTMNSDQFQPDTSHDCKKRKRDDMEEKESGFSTHIKEEVVDEGCVENSAAKTEEKEKKSEIKKRVCFAPSVDMKDEDCEGIKRSSKKKKTSSTDRQRHSQNIPEIKNEPLDSDTTFEEQIPEQNSAVVIKQEKPSRSRTHYIPHKLIDLTDPKFLRPFDFGWTREIVIRGTVSKGSSKYDVYYHSPQNKKVRSLKEIELLLKDDKNLCVANFTLRPQRILSVPDISKEIVRPSKTTKSKNCDDLLSSIEFSNPEDQRIYNELLESCTPVVQIKRLTSTKKKKKNSSQKSSRKSNESQSSSKSKKLSTVKPLKSPNILQDQKNGSNDKNVPDCSSPPKKSSAVKSPKTQHELQNQENSSNDIKVIRSSNSRKKSSSDRSPKPRLKLQIHKKVSSDRKALASSSPREKSSIVKPLESQSEFDDPKNVSSDGSILGSVIPGVTQSYYLQKLNLTRSSPDEFSQILPNPSMSELSTPSQDVANLVENDPSNALDVSKMCEDRGDDQQTFNNNGFVNTDLEITTDVPAVGLTIELTQNDEMRHSDVDDEVESFNRKTMNEEYDSRSVSLEETGFGHSRTSNLEESPANSLLHHDSNIIGDSSHQIELNHTYRKNGSGCQKITTNDWMRSVDELFKVSSGKRSMDSADETVLTTNISRKQDDPSPTPSLGSHSNPLKGPSPIENFTTEFLYATLQMNTPDNNTPVEEDDLDHESNVVDKKHLPRFIEVSEADLKYPEDVADNTACAPSSTDQSDADEKLSASHLDSQTTLESNGNLTQTVPKYELSSREEKYLPKIPEDSVSETRVPESIFCPTSESTGFEKSENNRKVIVADLYSNTSAERKEHFNSQCNMENDDTLIEHDISAGGASKLDGKCSPELPEVSEPYVNIKLERKQRDEPSDSQSNDADDDSIQQDVSARQLSGLDEKCGPQLPGVSESCMKVKLETETDFTSELTGLDSTVKLESDEKFGSDLDVKSTVQTDGSFNIQSKIVKVDTPFDPDNSNHEFGLSGGMCLPKTVKQLDLDSDQSESVAVPFSNSNGLASAAQLEHIKELDADDVKSEDELRKDDDISCQSSATDDENSLDRKNASNNFVVHDEACLPRTIKNVESNEKQIKSEDDSAFVLNGFHNTDLLENGKITNEDNLEFEPKVRKDEDIALPSMAVDDGILLDQKTFINQVKAADEKSSLGVRKDPESNEKWSNNIVHCPQKLIGLGSIEDPQCNEKPIANGHVQKIDVQENVEHLENGGISTSISSVEPFDDTEVLADSISIDAGETTREDVTLSDLNYSPLGFDQSINGVLKIRSSGIDQSQDNSQMSDSMSTTISVSYDSDDLSTAKCDSDDSENSRHESSPNDSGLNNCESTGEAAMVACFGTDAEDDAMDDTALSYEVHDEEDIRSDNDSSDISDTLSTMSQEIPISGQPPYRVTCRNPDIQMNGQIHTEESNDLGSSELESALPRKLILPKVTSPALSTPCSNADDIEEENEIPRESEFTEEDVLESYSQIVCQAGLPSVNVDLNDSTVDFDQNEIIEQSTILSHGQMGINYEDVIKNDTKEMSSSCQYESAHEEASRFDSDFSDRTKLMSHFSGNSTLDDLSDRSSLCSYQEDQSGLNETVVETQTLSTLESVMSSTPGFKRNPNNIFGISSNLQEDHAKADSVGSSHLSIKTLEKTLSDVPYANRNIPTRLEDQNDSTQLYTEASVGSAEKFTRLPSSVSEDEDCSFRCTVSELRQVNAILAMDSELQTECTVAVESAPPSLPPLAAEPVRPNKRARFSSLETHAYTHSMVSYSALHKALKMAFHYLNFKDLLRCRETSQCFRDLAELRILWKKVCLNSSEMNRLLVEILNKYGTEHLKVVDQDEEDWASFIDAISEMKYLSVLELCVCPAPVLEKIVDKCPRLRVISAQSIHGDCLNIEKIKNVDLEKLYLRATESMSLAGDLSTVARFSNLTHLSLRSIKNLKMALVEAVQCSHGLVLLELGDCSEFHNNFGSATLVYLQNLERLRLENVSKSGIADILGAVSKLGKLSHLELVNVDITVGFDANLHKCRNIRKLMLVPSYESKEKIAQTNKSILRNTYSLTETLKNFTWGVNEDLVQLPVESSDEDSVQSTEPMFSAEMMKILYGVGEERSAFQVVESDSFSLTTIQKFYDVHLPRTIVKILQIPSSEVLNLEM